MEFVDGMRQCEVRSGTNIKTQILIQFQEDRYESDEEEDVHRTVSIRDKPFPIHPNAVHERP